MRWTLIVDHRGRPGHHNMSTDYALLERTRPGVAFLRIYRWNPACLSFGRNEPAARRYDRERIEQLGMDTVRRPTGGRAVWHSDEVTYAVTAARTVFGTAAEAYRAIHQVIAEAILTLGLPAELAPPSRSRTPGLGSGACFTSPVGGEVTVQGQKVAGSAQLHVGEVFLQHGSILLHDDQGRLEVALRASAPPTASAGINDLLTRPIPFGTVAEVLAHHARAAWSGDWTVESGSNLKTECYNFDDPQWTWRR